MHSEFRKLAEVLRKIATKGKSRKHEKCAHFVQALKALELLKRVIR